MLFLLKEKIKSFLIFIFSKKNRNENLIQFFFRGFYPSDSRGNPSITVLILFFIMTLVGINAYVEFKLAFTSEIHIDANGSQTIKMRGLSDNWYFLLGALAAVIITFFNNRESFFRKTDIHKNENDIFSKIGENIKKENLLSKGKEIIEIIRKSKTLKK